MPTLNLSFWDTPALNRMDCFEVESVMLFPSDEATQRHYTFDQAIQWFTSEQDADTRRLIQDHVLLPANDDSLLPTSLRES